MSITPGTLTVEPALLLVVADTATKQYSDGLPPFTATMQGFVLGETPSVLSGVLQFQTTATPSSGPGTYPITVGGVSSSDYAITFAGGTLTVTAEDARVAFLTPLIAVVSPAGAPSGAVTLAASVLDISSTSDANGDNMPGDVRHAMVSFIDRGTQTTLCTALLGLVDPSDQRSGTASCTFNAPPGTSTIGIRVSGHYTRDAAADDATLTVVQPTNDVLSGAGYVTLSTSAGAYTADASMPAQFISRLRYDVNGITQGMMTLRFSRTANGTRQIYEIAAAHPTLLIVRSTVGRDGVCHRHGIVNRRDQHYLPCCHDSPYLSLSQPHCSASGSAESFPQ